MQIKKLIQNNKKIIKFTVSGATVALVEFSLLFFLTEKVGLWYLLSSGIGFTVAFIISFTLQKFWTFKDYCREKIYKQLSLFLAVGLFNLCLNQTLLFVLVEYFGAHYLLAQMFIAGLLGIGSFVFYKLFVFRKYDDTCGGKHILIASGIFPPDLGGPATFAASLADGLVADGHKVRVVSFGRKNSNVLPYKISKVDRKQVKLLRYLNYFLRLWHYANQSDVIYAMDMISVGLPCAIVKLLDRRIKFVVRLGGDHQWESALSAGRDVGSMEEYYEKGVFSFKEKIIIFINNFVLSRADVVIFNSVYLRDIILKHKKISADKVVVIKNITPTESKIECIKKKENDTFEIIYAGRLTVVKNLSRLMAAVKIVRKEENDKKIILKLIGDGPEKERLSKDITNFRLGDNVKILDRMDREALFCEIYNADMVAVPSLTEFNSNLVSEGLSMGKPVLLTDKSEHYYIGDKGKLLFYVNPLDVDDIAEKILEIFNNKEEFVNKQSDINKESWDIKEVVASHIKIFNK